MTRRLSYKELSHIPDFMGRFEYLKLHGVVGMETYGADRYLNQRFYTSREWADIRRVVILRDNGCDLGIPGREIYSGQLVHHMNPMLLEHIRHSDPSILDPDNLILTCKDTHNAIHFGDASLLPKLGSGRLPGDTTPWKGGVS